jgi:hypothetical protein
MRKTINAAIIGYLIFFAGQPVVAAPEYGWHMAAVGVTPTMHQNFKMRGTGVVVGVFDSPVRCTHVSFGDRCTVNYGYFGSQVPPTEAVPGQHGTHVGGIIAASDTEGETVGVAPGVELRSWQTCLTSTPACGVGSVQKYGDGNVTRARGDAFDLFSQQGMSVSNHSYGGGNSFGWGSVGAYEYDVMASRYPNNVFVWAAGNSHFNAADWTFASNVQPRDELKNFIVVTALLPSNELVYFSNAPGENGFCNISSQVCLERNKFKYFTVSAPGTNILSAGHLDDTGTYNSDGTSMAAPIVSGVVALLQGYWPALKSDASKVTSIIFGTAQDLGEPGVDNLYGWGLVRADRAMSPLGATYLSGAATLPDSGSTPSPSTGANCVNNQSASDIYTSTITRRACSSDSSLGGIYTPGGTADSDTPEDESGVAHLPEGGVRRATYSLSTSKLRVSPALSALTQHNISFFDEYGRDFQMPLATYAPSYQGTVQNWIRTSSVRNEYVLSHGANLSSALSAQGYDPMNPSMADIQWRMSYQANNGNAFHFGQGPALDQLDTPASLTFGLMADKTIQAGAYPVMSLAEGGVYAVAKQPLSLGFSIAGAALTNSSLDSDAQDREYAPQTDALMISLGKVSKNEKLSGSVSVTYLLEDDGVLGTGGAGGLGFTDGSDSQAITLGTNYQLSNDSKISVSYTEAFSQGGIDSGKLLNLNSSRLSSSAFAVGLESGHLLSKTDRLRLSVSQPLRVNGGSMSLNYDDFYDEALVLHSRSVNIDLEPTGRQIDYQLQYTFSPKQKPYTMGLFAYYANDYLHQSGVADHGVGVRIQGHF